MNKTPVRDGQTDPAAIAASLYEEVQAVGDLRFRGLFSAEQWGVLPAAVRVRFSKRLGAGRTVTYLGDIIECRMSPCGYLLAQALRLIGGPLPISRDTDVPATVVVTEDEATGGQFWTRIYGQHKGFPQAIQSSKRFAGATGLEEYIGYGCGMALRVEATPQGLHFYSHHYFLKLGRWRLRLPRFMTPGALTVSHVDCGDDWFAFVLDLRHPWLGELVHQTVMFCDQH